MYLGNPKDLHKQQSKQDEIEQRNGQESSSRNKEQS